MNEVPKGYIIMGCFGRYFSEQESHSSCELCGSHWTEARIDGFDSLKDYALSESVEELMYDVNTETEFKKLYEEEKDWLKHTYISVICEVLNEYDISYDNLYEMSFKYWRNKIVKN